MIWLVNCQNEECSHAGERSALKGIVLPGMGSDFFRLGVCLSVFVCVSLVAWPAVSFLCHFLTEIRQYQS